MYKPVPLRCPCCGSELVKRSRTRLYRLACQNWRCREFDKPRDPSTLR